MSKSEDSYLPILVVICGQGPSLIGEDPNLPLLKLVCLHSPTLADLCRALRAGHKGQAYSMVHISGAITDDGSLRMEHENGEDLVSPELLGEAFQDAGVSIALINLDSGVTFAPALLEKEKRRVLTVVTTAGKISAPEAALLAQGLYAYLAGRNTVRDTIGDAVNFAKGAIVEAYLSGDLPPLADWGKECSLKRQGCQRAANLVLCGDQNVSLSFFSPTEAAPEAIFDRNKSPNNLLHINSFLLAQMEELKSRSDVLLTTLVTALADREEAWNHWSAIHHLLLELLREDLQEKIEAGNGETYVDLAKAQATIMGALVQLEQMAHARDHAQQVLDDPESISTEKFLTARERAQRRHRVQRAGFVELGSPLVLGFTLFFTGLVLCVIVFASAPLLRVWEAEQARQREARLEGILAARLVKNVLDAAADTSLGTTPATLTSLGPVEVRLSADGGVSLFGSVDSLKTRDRVVRLAAAVVGPERVHSDGLRVEAPIVLPERRVVGRGDTLWSIASKSLGHGHHWTEIAAVNPGIEPRKMPVGLELTLPQHPEGIGLGD